jgi:hypothetical protein
MSGAAMSPKRKGPEASKTAPNGVKHPVQIQRGVMLGGVEKLIAPTPFEVNMFRIL